MAMPLLVASCSGYGDIVEEPVAGEVVEVSFSAALPHVAQTRAANASALNVDRVVCAVFEAGSMVGGTAVYSEIAALRDTLAIAANQNIVYSPGLVNGRTYKVVFWAMNGGNYNVGDMSDISPKIVGSESYTGDPVLFECFAGCMDLTVSGPSTELILLTRPLARINLGASNADMQSITDLGYTILTKVEVSFSFPQSYDALGQSCGTAQSRTMILPVTDGSLTVGGTDYKALASYMVFTDNSPVALTYKLYGKKGGSGSEEEIVLHTIQGVPVGVNKNTNIVGDLISGIVG